MSPRLTRVLSLLWLLALGACASQPSPPTAAAAEPPPLLDGLSLGQSRGAQQVVRAAFADQEATLNCVVEVSPQRMNVIALNAVGMRLFSVAAENDQLKVERAPGVPEQLQPTQVLRDLQLAYWPLATLQQAWRNSRWEVSEPFAGTRRLKYDGRLIAEVHYAQPQQDPWAGRLWLSNYQFGYSLAIDSTPEGD